MTVPSITLNNGVTVPQVGLGVFQVPDDGTQANVEQALERGYRHIDTAAGYYNEDGVGAALRASGLPREELFVTTKLRNGDQGYDSALRAFEDSRRALGLDVVDLYLIHWPVPSKDLYVETWKAFEKLLADGAVRAVGVSNFLPEHLDRLVSESDVVPAVNQIEVHPTFQQLDVQAACRKHGIAVEAYSPLGRGADLEASAVESTASALGVTPAQVVLRWHVQQGTIVIPKSLSAERQAANIDVFSFELNEEQMAAVSGLDSGVAGRTGSDPATADFTQFRA
ncbi:diketogulonate reductase-like aldo/keto reductase [Isoptericola sp. CG 20/1183]|uniref:Diketogulonate reductase-like aldo/keto reductase n=1 Tax=Isoptericola halotolerans TaxID=300560 RepID=A0ABX5EKH4_9MICO|nr:MULTISPECIES: aldo/keto reductase [Isoptericola]PRZ08631.1 diketogulonate reductase-like aldo/keto reductase [Isoptericola halotolerans]PRZ10922.1 diketogulonate reductase-like aldo/keto reductase [Isoptericola sp. CG 20/1183]